MTPLFVQVGGSDGLVSRSGDAVIVIGEQVPSELRAAVLAVLAALSSEGITPSGQLTRRIVAATVHVDQPLGSLAAAVRTPRGLEILLIGTAEAQWRDPGGLAGAFSASSAAAFVDHVLPSDTHEVILRVDEGGQADPRTNLRDGVVVGNCATLAMTAAGHSEPSADLIAEPIADPVAEVPGVPDPPPGVELIDLDASPEERPPLVVATSTDPTKASGSSEVDERVLVEAIECAIGHTNHPEARYCVACGRGFAQGSTLVLKQRERPPLGVLVVGDGSVFTLDSDYVIGRDPYDDPAVAAGSRPLVVTDESRSVSRVHAEVQLHGWDVLVVDRGSRNGTFVLAHGATEWTPVGAEPLVVPPGGTVAVGDRTMVFESHHRAADD